MEPECCRHDFKKRKTWYLDPLFIIFVLITILLSASYFFAVLAPFRFTFFDYMKMIWLPVLIGFVLGGIIDYYIPQEYISKFLAVKKKRTVFYAASLGFLASACSHGIIALTMELHKKGASGPAVVSFLLASPWSNLPITVLLLGFFGWKGLFIIVAALFVSINTGLIFQVLDRKGLIEHNKHSVELSADFSIKQDLIKRLRSRVILSEAKDLSRDSSASGLRMTGLSIFKNDLKGVLKGTLSLIEMVLWWILLGMLLASLISAFVPDSFFHRFMAPSFFGLLITLAIATVLEICSEGTSPLAFEIYKQTGAFGNAFAFLMGGVVTDYTEIGLIWLNIGKKTALWMIAVTIPQVLLIGWIFNTLL